MLQRRIAGGEVSNSGRDRVIAMTKTSDLVEFFRSHLDYDCESGAFRWVNPHTRGGSKEQGLFTIKQRPNGRFVIQIDKKRFNAKLVAWMMHYGVEPSGELRLIDGDSLAIRNIRDFVKPVRAKRDFDSEFISEFLEYDPDTGAFRWNYKINPACVDGWFIPKDVGKGAGSIDVFGQRYICTHIAWLLHWGVWPTYEIDHIDGNNQNHKIDNLRDVPHVINMQNMKRKKHNKSGVSGVSICSKSGRFVVNMSVNGKTKWFGWYKTIEEASARRDEVCKQLGFHENHGKDR